jgi:hypothetical protein
MRFDAMAMQLLGDMMSDLMRDRVSEMMIIVDRKDIRIIVDVANTILSPGVKAGSLTGQGKTNIR